MRYTMIKQFWFGVGMICVFGLALQAFGAQSTIYPYTSPLQSNKNVAGKNNFNSVRDDANTDIQAVRNAQQTMNTELYATDALKANKASTVMLWSEWADGASLTTSSPPVAYNGSIYKCIAPYTKTAGEYPDTQISYFAEVTGSGGAGDIEGVTAGSGLTGGGTSSTVSIAIDPTYTQRRVSSSCSAGTSIRAIAEDGTVTCETDDTGSGSVPSGTVNGQVLLWSTDQWVASTPPWVTTASLGTGVATALGFAPNVSGGFLLYSTYAADPLIAWDSATMTEQVGVPSTGTNTVGVKSGVFQTYDADLTTWAGVTPGTGVATFLATPSSANLAAAVTGETGSGAAVFGTSPTLTTPIIADSSTLTFDESAADPDDADIQISATDGVFKIASVNGANNEDLTIDLDATTNKVKFNSGSGLTLITTGAIPFTGAIRTVGKSSDYTIGTDDADEAYGTLFVNSGASTRVFTLPSAVAGMSVCIRNGQGVAQILRLDAGTGDYIVKSTGARTSAAAEYYGATADAKNQLCVVAYDSTDWYVTSEVGTWTEE